jgi:hypothetical protein
MIAQPGCIATFDDAVVGDRQHGSYYLGADRNPVVGQEHVPHEEGDPFIAVHEAVVLAQARRLGLSGGQRGLHSARITHPRRAAQPG